jgi:hypothetical protein
MSYMWFVFFCYVLCINFSLTVNAAQGDFSQKHDAMREPRAPETNWKHVFAIFRECEQRQDGATIAKLLTDACCTTGSAFLQNIIIRKVTVIQDHTTLMGIIGYLRDQKQIPVAKMLLHAFEQTPGKEWYGEQLRRVVNPGTTDSPRQEEQPQYEPIDEYGAEAVATEQEPVSSTDRREPTGVSQDFTGSYARLFLKKLARHPLAGVGVVAVLAAAFFYQKGKS